MTNLLKKLFNRRKENVTLILLDEGNPENPTYHTLKPLSIIALLLAVNLGFILGLSILLYVTPLGNMIFDSENKETRQSVIEISERLIALQDSLHARDSQLATMRSVIAQGSDTVFTIQPMENVAELYESIPQRASEVQAERFQELDPNQIIYSRNLMILPDFPAEPPVSGSVTRPFNIERNHYGIDIAATEGAAARVVADGVITSADWTVNYGYVVHVHHGNGYMSTYKHISNIYKKKGDIIFKGDILGTVGTSGVLTSGPHIHFELWRDGIALDPSTYLAKLTQVN